MAFLLSFHIFWLPLFYKGQAIVCKHSAHLPLKVSQATMSVQRDIIFPCFVGDLCLDRRSEVDSIRSRLHHLPWALIWEHWL